MLFPNVLLSLHPDYVMAHLLTPLGPDRTAVSCSWSFSPEDLDRAEFDPSYAVDFWDITNRQDWSRRASRCNGDWRSEHWVPGVLAPDEDGVYQFVTMVAPRLSGPGRGGRPGIVGDVHHHAPRRKPMTHEVRGVVALAKGAPVSLETVLVPDPGPGEALVRVQACGVCHTDLHYREGGINDDFPFLLGHEAAGVVEAVGPGCHLGRPRGLRRPQLAGGVRASAGRVGGADPGTASPPTTPRRR